MTECCICLDDYSVNAKFIQLDCGHAFHSRCIRKWLLIQDSCAYCRKPIEFDHVRVIFTTHRSLWRNFNLVFESQSCIDHFLSPTVSVALMHQIKHECERQCEGESIDSEHTFQSNITHVRRDETFRANGLLIEVTPSVPVVDPEMEKLFTEYSEWFSVIVVDDVSFEDLLRSMESMPDCLVLHSQYEISITNTVDEDCIFGRFGISSFVTLHRLYEKLTFIQSYLDSMPYEVVNVISKHYPPLRRFMPVIKNYHPTISRWMCRRYSTKDASLKELMYTAYEHCDGFQYKQIHPTHRTHDLQHRVHQEVWRRIKQQLLERQPTKWLARRLHNQTVRMKIARVFIHKVVFVLNTSPSSSNRVPECFKPIRFNTVDNRETATMEELVDVVDIDNGRGYKHVDLTLEAWFENDMIELKVVTPCYFPQIISIQNDSSKLVSRCITWMTTCEHVSFILRFPNIPLHPSITRALGCKNVKGCEMCTRGRHHIAISHC